MLKQQAAYEAVQAYLKKNPKATVMQALAETKHTVGNYYAYKKKLEREGGDVATASQAQPPREKIRILRGDSVFAVVGPPRAVIEAVRGYLD